MKKFWNRIFIVMAILIMLLVIGGIGLKMFLDYQYDKITPPEMKEEQKKYSTEKIYFSKAYSAAVENTGGTDKTKTDDTETSQAGGPLDVKPFAKSSIDVMNEYIKLCDEMDVKQFEGEWKEFLHNNPDSINIPEKLQNDLIKFAPLIEVYINVVNLPDYEIEIWHFQNDPKQYAAFVNIVYGTSLLQAKSLQLLSEEKFEESLKMCDNLYKSSKASPYSTLLFQMTGSAIFSKGTTTMYSIISRNNNNEFLTKALLILNKYADLYAARKTDYAANTIDAIGSIRLLKRNGIDSEIEGKTGMELMAEANKAQARYIEKYELPAVKNDPSKTMEKSRMVDSYYSVSVIFGGQPRNIKESFIKMFSPFYRNRLMMIAMPNTKETHFRFLQPQAAINILQTYTAAKIYAINTGKQPEKLPDVISAEFEEIPADVYSENNDELKYNGTVYSIGPDRTDQKAELHYDPSNGTISPGDVYFK